MSFKLACLLLMFLASLVSFWIFGPRQPYQKLKMIPDRQLIQIKLGDETLTVEVVNSDQSRTQGLSGRSEIGADGMLFVLNKKNRPVFWMKQMQFNLDLTWINEGEVVGVITDAPAPLENENLEDLPYYQPKQMVELVLETESGQFEFKKQDQLKIRSGLINYFNIW